MSQPKQRNSFGLLFLAIPVGTLIWVSQTGYGFPVNHSALMLYGLPVLIALFAVIWWLAYGGDSKDRSMLILTVFFGILWFGSGFFFLAKLNSSLSSGPTTSYYRPVTEVRSSLSSTRSAQTNTSHISRTCHITIAPALANTENLRIPYDLCETITPGQDGIEVKVAPGLALPWIVDQAIIKDFASYKARLGLDDTADTRR